MAVWCNVFAKFLRENLSPELSILCQEPHVKVGINDPNFARFECGTRQCHQPQRYTLQPGTRQKVLSYRFADSASDSDFFSPISGDMMLRVTSSSEVFLIANHVRIVSSNKFFARVNIVRGVTS